MDFDVVVTNIKLTTATLASIVGLLMIYYRLAGLKVGKARDLHERYVKVKELSIDLESNYAEILIVLSGISKVKLSADEVRWFIEEPRAFLELEKYGRLPRRYIRIDLGKKEFALAERVESSNKRFLERMKILGLGFAILSVVIAVWLIPLVFMDFTISPYIPFSFITIYILAIIWGMYFMFTSLSDSLKMVGKP